MVYNPTRILKNVGYGPVRMWSVSPGAGTPISTIQVINVCLRSWNLNVDTAVTPVRRPVVLASAAASRTEPLRLTRVGRFGNGFKFGLGGPEHREKNQLSYAVEVAIAPWTAAVQIDPDSTVVQREFISTSLAFRTHVGPQWSPAAWFVGNTIQGSHVALLSWQASRVQVTLVTDSRLN